MPILPDPFWLLRVHVKEDGAPVPFELWILWHSEFLLPKAQA